MHHKMHVEIVDTYKPVLIKYIQTHMQQYKIKFKTIYIMEFTIKSVGLCLILCFGCHFLIFVNSRLHTSFTTRML